MKDLEKIISGLGKSGVLGGFAGGVAGGGLTSMLMGKSGKKMGKKALKVGALAAVGGLAWKAYQSYSQNKSAQPVANNRGFNFSSGTLSEDKFDAVVYDQKPEQGHMLLLRAMISAAYADGHIDATEQQKIFQQVETLDLSVEDKASLFDELRKPLSLEQLVANVPNSETGIEVYAASLVAIDLNQAASTRYLDQLATQLCLPGELRQAIHQQAGLGA